MRPLEAALRGAKEIGFTVGVDHRLPPGRVHSHPTTGGLFGRVFREFAVSLSVAVGGVRRRSPSPRRR